MVAGTRVNIGSDQEGQAPCAVVMRLCHIYSTEGTLSLSYVHCPKVAGLSTLDKCMRCPSYAGVAYGVANGREEANLLCHDPAARCEPSGDADEPSIAERTAVAHLLGSEVVCVRENVRIDFVAALLLEKGISGVPVVDAEGRPHGILSKTDLVRHGLEPMARTTVAEIMTPMSIHIPLSTPIARAAALMSTEGVHRLPVLADDGKIVGIVTPLDIVRWLAQHDGFLRSP